MIFSNHPYFGALCSKIGDKHYSTRTTEAMLRQSNITTVIWMKIDRQ